MQKSGMDIDLVRGVLAQPTRARLFVLLRELGRPVATADLAKKLDLHPNGIRLHLDRMAEAGVVERPVEHRKRGRPRDTWAVVADAQASDDLPTAYANLGRWLAQVMPDGKEGVGLAESGGERIGRDLAATAAGDSTEDRLHDAFASLGFQPVADEVTDAKMSFRLCNCPYRDVVKERAQIVCGLHRGITRGLLQVIAPGTTLSEFHPKDPENAGCMVVMKTAESGV
jgi:predicted ArsR family transcriptional regulator